ncbi:hypothetical protein FNV43_RR18071 [Rhamnella rubrinervis]|uniref:Uncharacterized protein n=1 Tax=Rhamnella rubrinervis TaxID=2594499 RepID=A0A8K0E2Z7_9ROSA|nr:hypothetical protein FNV43_RR18071 [Rhamnella rubrinervis]
MGICFGRNKGVHPLEDEEQPKRTSTSVRVKVRMTTTQLKELTAQVDTSKGDSDQLGRLILRHCLEGRIAAHVECQQKIKCPRESDTLSTIFEEETDGVYELGFLLKRQTLRRANDKGVHPLEDGGQPRRTSTSFKVRMTTTQLKELMAQVESSKGDSDQLGRLILHHCLEGRVAAVEFQKKIKCPRESNTLSTIFEEEN